MTDIGSMTHETFEAEWPTIAAQVHAIRADAKSRRRFRALAVYCDASGELVAEVFRTGAGPVIVYRRGSGIDDRTTSARDRQIEVEPVTGDPRQSFFPDSSAANYMLQGRDIARAAEAGQGKVTLHQTGRVVFEGGSFNVADC